jgi:putative ABC transport system permease protein
VLPATSGGVDLRGLLGKRIRVQVTRSTGQGEGQGVERGLRVVALSDPSWQIDGPDAAYVDPVTVLSWAALRAGVPARDFADTVGYESATVVSDSSGDVPRLLDRLQEQGYAATSLQQQLEALPGVLDLVRIAGLVLLVSLVVLTGFSAYQVTAALGRQRRREVGILKAVGFSDGAVFRMLAGEAAAVGLVGAALGLAGAAVLGSAGTLALRSRAEVREFLATGVVLPSLPTVAAAVAIVLVVMLTGALVPAVRAARLPPAEAIRQW